MKISTHATRLRRSLAVAAAALLATVSLSACNADELGAAAIVDGHTITTQQLQTATQGYLAAVPDGDKSNAQLRILERMILSRVIDQAAAKEDVRVGKGAVARQRDQILESTNGRKGLIVALSQQQNPVVLAPSLIDQWVRDQLLYGRLVTKIVGPGDPNSQEAATQASAALIAAGKSMDITVNPRYGTWNPQRGVQPQISGGLSRTAAQLDGK
jgi:hypothetical protein